MKGSGEPCFENDFPPGSDMIGEIMNGPKAAERMEFELFSRLNAFETCGWSKLKTLRDVDLENYNIF